MFLKGLRFGMIIQFAIGPVCLFILSTAINTNFMNSLIAVFAVVIVDAIYIILAIFGIVSFIKIPKYQLIFKVLSGLIVLLFGINIIMNNIGFNFIPNINLFSFNKESNSFIYAFVLTASNPLTILFWSGVLSSKIIDDNLKNKDLKYFGFGCISATFIFLTSPYVRIVVA